MTDRDPRTVAAGAEPSLDAAAWDTLVALDPRASYLQQTAWGRVKAANGWRAVRVVARSGEGTARPARLIGGQVLLRRPRGVPWSFGYAPRGPMGALDDDAIAAWTAALRGQAWGERVALVRIDPELEAGTPADASSVLDRAGWRRSPSIQPLVSRVVDLHAGEAALWSDLRKKWRQYVNKARSAGVTIVEVDADRLPEFHAILTETARRAGTRIRAASAYRDVWDAFRASGQARLLFAIGPDGDAQAALLLVRCGARVVEPYGGMTAAGAASRANYLVKWEAIRSSTEAGAVSYDMWGLVHPGIEQFKAGFGGREITYIGGWELPIDRLGALAYRTAAGITRAVDGLRGTGRVGRPAQAPAGVGAAQDDADAPTDGRAGPTDPATTRADDDRTAG